MPHQNLRHQLHQRRQLPLGRERPEVQGYRGIQLFRRPLGEEIEFLTIMWFKSWAAVKEFAGEDYERAYVPSQAREVLARFDECALHYEVRERLDY